MGFRGFRVKNIDVKRVVGATYDERLKQYASLFQSMSLVVGFAYNTITNQCDFFRTGAGCACK